jgi:RNA polymerase primary sigma factor
MKKNQLTPYSTAERRRVLAEARSSGELSWSSLDRLLLDACRTRQRRSALLRSLDGVCVVDAGDPVLSERLEVDLASTAGIDHFGHYADQVRRIPRLTREQEHVLARRLEFALARLEREVDRMGLPESTRETVLRGANCAALSQSLSRLESGGQDDLRNLPCRHVGSPIQIACSDYNRLRAHFVERNLQLVVGMATAYRTYGIPLMDLVQEGNASLIRAVEKFDWRKDVRFQTYATFWIRQAIERLITANRGIVRVPNYIQQKMRRLRREGKLPRNHRDMDLRDVSKQFDTTQQAAARLMETDRAWYSLDVPLTDEESSFASMLAAEEGDDEPMSASELLLLGKRLDKVMEEHLTDQERDILTMRFGLGGTRPKTLDQIGEQMSVSRERIRQMQVRALDKLQKPRLLEELKDFL